jgi:hypothetical protein
MAIRFISKATVKNKLVRSSNVWDGTAVYSPFTLVGNYDALATVTVPSGGLSSITFAGIPTTGYSHLQVRYLARGTESAAGVGIRERFNGDTSSSYATHQLYGDGSSVTASAVSSVGQMQIGGMTGATAGSNIFGVGILDILDYANTTKNKTVRCLDGRDINGSGGLLLLESGVWLKTNAIDTVLIYPSSGNFAQYSQFALYGVKA